MGTKRGRGASSRRAGRCLPRGTQSMDDPVDETGDAALVPQGVKLADVLGPGLLTGASDDDPSGIATYSQAGAQFGYAPSWSLVLTYPLMTAVQMISAHVGRTTGQGLAGNIARCYPAWAVYSLIVPLLIANVI